MGIITEIISSRPKRRSEKDNKTSIHRIIFWGKNAQAPRYEIDFQSISIFLEYSNASLIS